ncbi:hypothetical protein A6M23_19780 [Acidithiobacillus thiooxidans]|uniref:Uncharacterized protein n=1 Tax=Acidithiobacillus thiooxidans TaxID=930 RepID=A0A1C2IYF7_ACITH|nr:hypothetical protein A6M23_19780 [Acidithiobacillus thiooxidans]OCX81066.1 hypothetical protein A6P08_14650 [Acidithiobacillus thiooxidans]
MGSQFFYVNEHVLVHQVWVHPEGMHKSYLLFFLVVVEQFLFRQMVKESSKSDLHSMFCQYMPNCLLCTRHEIIFHICNLSMASRVLILK